MDELGIIFGLILFVLVFGGIILGWIAFFQIRELKNDNRKIHAEIHALKIQREEIPIDLPRVEPEPSEKHADIEELDSEYYPTETDENTIEDPPKEKRDWISQPTDVTPVTPSAPSPSSPTLLDQFIQHFIQHWMIWIGGASIGFSGIFLVKYSMDNGWLGPMARVLAGLVTGVLLHIAAYMLHKRQGPNQVFAALSGGASLVLYAAVLAAFHLYQFVDPIWAFSFLAVISLLTMLLALIQGPMLAALGILGAYLVPVFVNSGSNNMSAALVYSFIVTCSALLLVRYVGKRWLWVGTLVGAGFWWLVSLTATQIDVARFVYLLGLAYVVTSIHHWDLRLLTRNHPPTSDTLLDLLKGGIPGSFDRNYFALVSILGAWIISLAAASQAPQTLWPILTLPIFLLWLGKHHTRYLPLAWLSLVGIPLGLLVQGMDWSNYTGVEKHLETQWLTLLTALACIYSAGGYWIMRSNRHSGYWSALTYMSPLIFLVVAHLLVNALETNWRWSVGALLLGMVYFYNLSRKRQSTEISPQLKAVLIIAGHFAYSLAVVMLAREATLTLALALQIVSLVWIDRHLRLPILPYLVKAVLAMVILRLTFNPWLLTYPSEMHWSLWTYGGALLCVLWAIRLIKDRNELSFWLQGAALHLFALTVISETRYLLYDGSIFTEQYSFFEAAFYTAVAGVMGIVYRLREKFAGHLSELYYWLGNGLLIAALVNFLVFVLFVKNPFFTAATTMADTPIFNILLLAFGFPCCLAGAAFYVENNQQWRRLTGIVFATAVFIFTSFEVRHLWQGQLYIELPVITGELYSYSMLWLCLAITASLASVRFKSHTLYKGGMALLILVVLKIFLVDTSGLSSLWRVASFMGLGIALLGLAYFHQAIRDSLGRESAEET